MGPKSTGPRGWSKGRSHAPLTGCPPRPASACRPGPPPDTPGEEERADACDPGYVDISTGYDRASGVVLGDGVPDDTYTVDAGGGPVAAFTLTGIPSSPWVANDGLSRWIGLGAGLDGAPGIYVYRARFELGADAPLAVLTGTWAVDDLEPVLATPGVHRIIMGGWDAWDGFGCSLGIWVDGAPVTDADAEWLFLGTDPGGSVPPPCLDPALRDVAAPGDPLACPPKGGGPIAVRITDSLQGRPPTTAVRVTERALGQFDKTDIAYRSSGIKIHGNRDRRSPVPRRPRPPGTAGAASALPGRGRSGRKRDP